jgi:hypothetical protein
VSAVHTVNSRRNLGQLRIINLKHTKTTDAATTKKVAITVVMATAATTFIECRTLRCHMIPVYNTIYVSCSSCQYLLVAARSWSEQASLQVIARIVLQQALAHVLLIVDRYLSV